MDRRDFEMRNSHKLLLCLAVTGALLPMAAHAAPEIKSVSAEETAAISENSAPEAEVLAS